MMLCRLLSVDHSPEMVNVIQSSISGYPIPAFLLLLQPSRQEHTQNEETPIAKKNPGDEIRSTAARACGWPRHASPGVVRQSKATNNGSEMFTHHLSFSHSLSLSLSLKLVRLCHLQIHINSIVLKYLKRKETLCSEE